MRDEVVAEVSSRPEHKVQHTLWQPGFLEYFDEPHRQEWRIGSRLEDDRVPEDESRHELPGWDGEREIPWSDRGDHAHRVPHAHRPFVGKLRGDDIPELAAPLAGDVIRHVDALLDIPAGFGEDLAHLAGHFPGEVVLPCEHDLAGSVEDLAALGRRKETPTVERAPRGVHRAVHVGDRRFGHVRDELTGRGVRVFERAAAGSVEPAAVDEVLEHWRRHVG